MGLLDDAIKEHLELKRRRGADPGEVSRQETEALGPVRRGEVDLAERVATTDAPSPPERDDDDLGYDDLEPEPQPEPEEESATPPHGDPLRDAALGGRERPAAHEREADFEATPPHGDPLAHQPTRQFSADEVQDALGRRDSAPGRPDPEAATGDADEDVLEETPEFLQETPEHDRLWFEQKPPKDFDF
jgi:hypothetical protein